MNLGFGVCTFALVVQVAPAVTDGLCPREHLTVSGIGLLVSLMTAYT